MIRPRLPICFYSLYAAVSDDPTIGGLVDRLIAGEYESELVEWVEALGDSPALRPATSSIDLGRHEFHTPSRAQLPPLNRYARLERDGEEQLAGYVEASHGCVHKCRHCPVPVACDGRIRIVGSSVVMADIAQLVAAGARHITFGDPDFLNGVKHSLQVARELHRHFPEVTFDCTTKVEHILEHRQVWPELSEYGCLFVISAFESLNAEILLSGCHTADEAAQAVALLREHAIEDPPVVVAVHALGDAAGHPRDPRFRDCQRDGGERRSDPVRSVCSCPRARCCSIARDHHRTCRTTIATASRMTGKPRIRSWIASMPSSPKSSRPMSRRRSTACRRFGPCIGRWPMPRDLQPTPPTLATSSRARGSPRA